MSPEQEKIDAIVSVTRIPADKITLISSIGFRVEGRQGYIIVGTKTEVPSKPCGYKWIGQIGDLNVYSN
jgi:hypothetical protein